MAVVLCFKMIITIIGLMVSSHESKFISTLCSHGTLKSCNVDSIPFCDRLRITQFKDIDYDSNEGKIRRVKPVAFGSSKISDQYGSHVKVKPDNEKVKKWICETTEILENAMTTKKAQEIKLTVREEKEHNFYKESVRFNAGVVTFINFHDGNKLYCKTTSYYSDPKTGDITICMDSNQRTLYLNRGHVCGDRIDFVVTRPVDLISIDTFMVEFRSEADDIGWKKMDL